jgi:hypothetical protein
MAVKVNGLNAIFKKSVNKTLWVLRNGLRKNGERRQNNGRL